MQTANGVLLVLTCGLIGCKTTNTTQQTDAKFSNSSTFVHSFTRFSFPNSVGAFRRVDIHEYDQRGRDVGVGYDSPTPIAATVYVYPGPKDFALLPSPKPANTSEALLNQHFLASKQDIIRNHPDAKFISESPCKIIQGKDQFEGKRAAFYMNYKFGFTAQESVSELYLFLIEPGVKFLATDRYFVKYRITFPTEKKAQAEHEVTAFMIDLVWPTKQLRRA